MPSVVADKQEIQELKYRYGVATDEHDVETLLDLLTTNVTFDIEIWGTGEGHDEIREYMEWYGDRDFEVSAHNIFNPRLTVDEDTAEGEWYFLVLYKQPDGTVDVGHGRYVDEYERVDSEWKIASYEAQRRLAITVPSVKYVAD